MIDVARNKGCPLKLALSFSFISSVLFLLMNLLEQVVWMEKEVGGLSMWFQTRTNLQLRTYPLKDLRFALISIALNENVNKNQNLEKNIINI